MVFFKAQKLQRLTRLLQRIQGEIDREGGEAAGRIEEDLADAARPGNCWGRPGRRTG